MTDAGTLKHEWVAVFILGFSITVGLWQVLLTASHEAERPASHWDNPAFDQLAKALGSVESAVFLTDEEGRPTANGRIHSCQFAIIPARLIVKTDWDSFFAEMDRGAWCIYDAANPKSIDKARAQLEAWSIDSKRTMSFQRFGPNLALFRSRPKVTEDNR